MSENSPTRTSVPQPEAEPETLNHLPDSPASRPDGAPTATGPAAAGADPVPERIGEYLVVRKIGEGGMGSVYLAEDPKLGRKAAVKTMRLELAARKENRDRFVREARAAAAVEHDNIVPIWGVGEAADGTPYIAMPFLHGEMLDARLKRERVSPVALLLAVGRDVADGLAAAHAQNLVHRDIKPANIWLEGDPASAELGKQVRRAKVLDFGLARSSDQENTQLTATGAVLGTPSFMAPEQARGDAVDHRADLWSLGVTLYRMATGRLPFRGANTMAVLYALASEAPPPVCDLNPAVPPALGALIDQLMQKDVALRPQTAEEVAERLRQTAADQPASAAGRSIPVLVLPDAAPDPWEGVTEADAPGASVVRPHAPKPRPKRDLLLPAVGVLTLAVLCALLAVVVVKVQTAEGTLTVEVADADAEARFQGGRLVLAGADGKERYVLAPSERRKTIDAGKYTARVEGADGLALDASEVTLNKNGAVTIRVVLATKPAAKRADPPKKEVSDDRKAAEWVLSVGGEVCVNNRNHKIRAVKDLPADPLTLTWVELNGLGDRVTDEGLAHLRGCRELAVALIWGASVTDAGAEHLKELTKLTFLTFGSTKLTDAGLRHFKGLTELRSLGVSFTGVTNAGLVELKGLPHLASINAGKTGVTCAGFEPFKGSPTLRELVLGENPLTDADVDHLAALHALDELWLHETQLSDTGLLKLTPLKRLATLNVAKTKVTAEGVKALAKALPRCKITWDGGVIEPTEKVSPDRRAAEWVLSVGGYVRLRGQADNWIAKAVDLSQGEFAVAGVRLGYCTKVDVAGMALVAGCAALEEFSAHHSSLTDECVAHLQELTTLTHLNFGGCVAVTDRIAPHLKKLTALKFVDFNRTSVGDAVAEHLGGCPDLELIGAGGTRVSDAGVAHWKSLKKLKTVNVIRSQITGAGVLALRECPALTSLHLGFASFPADTLAALGQTPGLRLLHLEEVGLQNEQLAHFKGLNTLETLVVCRNPITDEGLSHLKGLGQLRVLDLSGTSVESGAADYLRVLALAEVNLEATGFGDDGLAKMIGHKTIEVLWLGKSKVTAERVKAFAKAMPQCKIGWDGGLIEPTEKK
jgi:serine/threonine protein kinase